MSLFDEIKGCLPNFPDQVIEVWLLPYAEELGWPPIPRHPKDNRDGWRYILSNQSMDYWANMTWEKTTSTLQVETLHPKAQEKVMGVAFGMGLYGVMNGRKERVTKALEYLKDHGTFPSPPAIIMLDGQMDIMDGSHRIAALTVFRILVARYGALPPAEEHDIWLGTPSATVSNV